MLLRSAILVVVFVGGMARAEEWPGWRGPRGDGTSTETGLPRTWGTTDNIAWTTGLALPIDDARPFTTDATFVWLGRHGISSDRMGVIGFDTGGTVAFVVAASRALGAAVSVGGGGILSPLSEGLPSLVDIADELACPWLGLYGDADEAIPVEEVQRLSRRRTRHATGAPLSARNRFSGTVRSVEVDGVMALPVPGPESGTAEGLLQKYGLTADDVVRAALELVGK